ncbi:TatD family hydrolase [Candidatus Acetothermia bacterium]|nr:TatD family hydrolase [Candidatus Acetothermia bacterium]MBI3643782.1 TatD family hydrolase [Candidatus Acetothermia bacterium]
MRLIDTHAHLDSQSFSEDREEAIQRAQAAGIQIITMGTDLDSSGMAVRMAQKHKLYAAVGIHPHQAQRYSDGEKLDDDVIPRLEALLGEKRVVAVGEIGLDYFKEFSPRDAQHVVFRALLGLAQKHKAPVVIHTRNSEEDVLKILAESKTLGVVHSFAGDAALAKKILDLGFYLGVNGIATFPKSGPLREAIKTIPIKRLLTETDCPFLAPIQHRGARNEPSFVEDVARVVSGVYGMGLEEFAKITTENAMRLFKLG